MVALSSKSAVEQFAELSGENYFQGFGKCEWNLVLQESRNC